MGHSNPFNNGRMVLLGGMRQGAFHIVNNGKDLFNQGFVSVVQQLFFFAVDALAIVFQISTFSDKTIPVVTRLLIFGNKLLEGG
jgi:hypothetical protein